MQRENKEGHERRLRRPRQGQTALRFRQQALFLVTLPLSFVVIMLSPIKYLKQGVPSTFFSFTFSLPPPK
jgi:hypothetical protein